MHSWYFFYFQTFQNRNPKCALDDLWPKLYVGQLFKFARGYIMCVIWYMHSWCIPDTFWAIVYLMLCGRFYVTSFLTLKLGQCHWFSNLSCILEQYASVQKIKRINSNLKSEPGNPKFALNDLWPLPLYIGQLSATH
jgi:hypothetical protein